MTEGQQAPPPVRTRSAGRATRLRVLRAAIELFAEQGYHSTGIRELSDRADLGRGALYYHIRSKEELLFDIARSKLDQQEKEARAIVESDQDPLSKLRLLTHHVIGGLSEDRQGWLVVSWETRVLEGEHRAEIARIRKRYQGLWVRTLAEAADAGLLRPADGVEIRGFMGMFNYTIQWLDSKGSLTPDAIAERYYRLIVSALAVPSSDG